MKTMVCGHICDWECWHRLLSIANKTATLDTLDRTSPSLSFKEWDQNFPTGPPEYVYRFFFCFTWRRKQIRLSQVYVFSQRRWTVLKLSVTNPVILLECNLWFPVRPKYISCYLKFEQLTDWCDWNYHLVFVRKDDNFGLKMAVFAAKHVAQSAILTNCNV